jgi:chromosome segregation ATPase
MLNESKADLQRRNESFGILQQSVDSKNLEIANLKQIIQESNERSSELQFLNEKFRLLQQSLESKNVEIARLQQIIDEGTHHHEQNNAELCVMKDKINELEGDLQNKNVECSLLKKEIKAVNEKLECRNDDLREIETKLKKEKMERVVQKKSEMKNTKELNQKVKKVETELRKAVADNLQKVQHLETAIFQKQAEIETGERRLAELQNVISWKDEQYQKIQVTLQAKFNQELKALQHLLNKNNKASHYNQTKPKLRKPRNPLPKNVITWIALRKRT